MKFLEGILAEYGADAGRAITILPGFGGYFCGVKRVEEYSLQKIELTARRMRIIITGENLTISKYYMQDLFIRGKISGVNVE